MIEVVQAGLLDLVVDGVARRGLRYGLSEAGPVDAVAMRYANRAVGNGHEAAALEMLLKGPTLAFAAPAVVAVAGGPLEPLVDGEPRPVGAAFAVSVAARLSFRSTRPGLRSYLAVRGGLAAEACLGSRSTDLPSQLPGLAGRALAAGDRLALGSLGGVHADGRAATLPTEALSLPPTALRVLPGPQWQGTPAAVRRHLLRAAFRVTPAANRVGIVLEAELPPPVWEVGTLVSEGTLAGSVQWTPAGRPVVLLVDRGSIGGYPKPLQVIAADAWRAGQLRPGDTIRFVRTTRREAWQALASVRAQCNLDGPGVPL